MTIATGSVEIFGGGLAVLSVGRGDTKLSFDPNNPQDRIRAARIVTDMLRRGYALLVEVERGGKKIFERATGFREDTCEYIVADFDPVTAEKADSEEPNGQPTDEAPGSAPSAEAPRKRLGGKRRVDAASTRAVAVARSAGG